MSDASYSILIIHAYEHSKDFYFCDSHQIHSKMKVLDITPKLVSVI